LLKETDSYPNAGITRNPTKTLEQKMGLPPARAETVIVVINPEARRWLSQFFAGIVNKAKKSVTVPAAWVDTNPKA